jgi:hypothetical protein
MTTHAVRVASPIDTRRAAHDAISPDHLGRQLQEVLVYLRQRGRQGATDAEISRNLKIRGDSSRARRCELRDAGHVVDSGERRNTDAGRSAVVWILAIFAGSPSRSVLDIHPERQSQTIEGLGPCGCGCGTFSETKTVDPDRYRVACVQCGAVRSFLWLSSDNPKMTLAHFPENMFLPSNSDSSPCMVV